MRKIIIGDVHGYYDTLVKLLNLVQPASDDIVAFVGDLIDRGDKSAQVINLVKQNKYLCVLGNHELLMMMSELSAQNMADWQGVGGNATLSSYTTLDEFEEDIEWLKKLPLTMDLGDVFVVHAGLDPNLPLGLQTHRQCCWIREGFINSLEPPYFENKTIIVGHTITHMVKSIQPGQVLSGHGWLGIDTGCYRKESGWLTALDATNQLAYQVNRLSDMQRCFPLVQLAVDVTQLQRRY